jgi:hypothetical protein
MFIFFLSLCVSIQVSDVYVNVLSIIVFFSCFDTVCAICNSNKQTCILQTVKQHDRLVT